MVNIRPTFEILSWIVICVGGLLLIPAGVDLAYDNPDWKIFVSVSMLSLFAGGVGSLALRNPDKIELNFRQAFFLIVAGWIVVTLFGSIPFVEYGLSFTDAVFETMSGITTTGSTVMSGLDHMPPGILLWRSLLQWLGGIGIIAVAVLILPILRVGGMQMFKIESSGSDLVKFEYTSKTLFMLTFIYSGLTAVCVLVYYILGMSFFDAVNHAMATLSTGGYSTHDASFGYFDNYALHWAGTLFMICGAIPFFLFVKATMGDAEALFTDQQVRGFLMFLAFSSVGMSLWLMARQDVGFFEALTLTSFNITSVVTTTGFATTDYTTWGNGAVGMFLVLMFVGGCSGSTSGAIKIYRFQVLWMFVKSHIIKLFSPNRVIILKYNGQVLQNEVPHSILAFLAVFIATIAAFTVLLTLMDIDILTAYSASVTAITNVGPGIGTIVGPAGNFQPLPDGAKWVLSCAMLAGRLEVLALLVLLEKEFWVS